MPLLSSPVSTLRILLPRLIRVLGSMGNGILCKGNFGIKERGRVETKGVTNKGWGVQVTENPSAYKKNVEIARMDWLKHLDIWARTLVRDLFKLLLKLPAHIKTKSQEYTFWSFLPLCCLGFSCFLVKWKVLSGYKKDPKRKDHYIIQWLRETTSPKRQHLGLETEVPSALTCSKSSLGLAPEPINRSVRTAKKKRKTKRVKKKTNMKRSS